MNHKQTPRNTSRRLLRVGPIALLALMLVAGPASALPLAGGLSIGTPLGPAGAGIDGTHVSAYSPVGSADVDGTNVQANTPFASASAGLDGTHVSACADADTSGLPVAVAASACADEDAGQIAEDAAPSGLKGLVQKVRSILGSLF